MYRMVQSYQSNSLRLILTVKEETNDPLSHITPENSSNKHKGIQTSIQSSMQADMQTTATIQALGHMEQHMEEGICIAFSVVLIVVCYWWKLAKTNYKILAVTFGEAHPHGEEAGQLPPLSVLSIKLFL